VHPTLTEAREVHTRSIRFAAKRTPEREHAVLTRILSRADPPRADLWVWPQRGITRKFSSTRTGQAAIVRVERQINLDFMTAASASLPAAGVQCRMERLVRTDRDGQ